MFPVLVIAIGIVVLALGKRLAVLGAAVGAIVGVAVLRLFNIPLTDLLLSLGIPIVLAVIGFFAAGLAKGIISIVLLVFGALAGAAIVLSFLDLFNVGTGAVDWLLALIGGVVGLVLIRRYKEMGMILLSGVIGALLVTRGLTIWLPVLEGALGTLIVIVLAGGSIGYQGGYFARRQAATAMKATSPAPVPAAPPPTPTPIAPPPVTDVPPAPNSKP